MNRRPFDAERETAQAAIESATQVLEEAWQNHLARVYHRAFAEGREQGRKDAYADWLLVGLLVFFGIIIHGWIAA